VKNPIQGSPKLFSQITVKNNSSVNIEKNVRAYEIYFFTKSCKITIYYNLNIGSNIIYPTNPRHYQISSVQNRFSFTVRYLSLHTNLTHPL